MHEPVQARTVPRRYTVLMLLVLWSAVAGRHAAWSQPDPFDASWYVPTQPHLKIGVVADGIYAVTEQELRAAGLEPASIPPASLRLLENGRPVPLWLTGSADSTWNGQDTLFFVGRRNTGADEAWAWGDLSDRSSDHFSLYSDTTYYWLTWGGGEPGLHYAPAPPLPAGTPRSTLRTTVHLEEDHLYYFGDSNETAQPPYTRGEGYYWHRFNVTTSPVSRTYTIPAANMTRTADSLRIRVRLSSESLPRHRVTLEVEGMEIDSVDWSGYTFQTLEATLPQHLIPAGSDVRIRVTSHHVENSNPNRVLLDWIEASFVHTLALDAGRPLRLDLPDAGTYTFQLTAPDGASITVLQPEDGLRYALTADANGQATFTVEASEAQALWAFTGAGARPPVRLTRPAMRDWADPSLAADYLIVTTPLLRPAAEALATYREQQDGYAVQIVHQQDLFDQFDYGRPTPIAIRRFLRATRQWARPPRFLLLMGDLVRPEDNRPRRPLAAWEVIAFGYSPSDAWFAMQLTSGDDWSEGLAIGRLPIRDTPTGLMFVDKIRNYESQPLGDWQKRVLQLAGGTDASQQALLQNYTTGWGEIVTAAPTGADTLLFFKSADAPLDPTFQDSLRLAVREGAGWMTYFGHSAADGWEIVTDQPEEYDNADRLPVVLSLGCNTGNVAGGRFELTDRLVLGERLVIGSANGAIAHWGSSSLSTIPLPGILTHELHEVVFADTARVLGAALQEAKRRFAAQSNGSSAAVRVLLQYNLIGDPATRINLPDRPDLHLPPGALSITPTAPITADSVLTVHLRLRNRGLVPADSVLLHLTHTLPDGSTRLYTRTIPPVFLADSIRFTLPIDTLMIGENRLQISADPLGAYLEEDETNNTAEQTIIVFASGVAVVTPPDLGLVTTRTPELRVSLSSRAATAFPVTFELDTTATFSSPARRTYTAPSGGIAATWAVAPPLQDGQTYFWRARLDDPSQPDNWTTAAFTVAPDLPGPGWLQQGVLFDRNITTPTLDVQRGVWQFKDYNAEVRVTSERGSGTEKGRILVNGEEYLSNTLGFGVVVLDGETGAIRAADALPTYQPSAGLIPRNGDSTQARVRFDEILAMLQPGDYVFVRTRHLGRASGPEIQDHIKARWRSLGSTAIDTLTYRHLWIMMTRAGHPEETQEWAVAPGPDATNEIARETRIPFSHPEGTTTSPPIGPAQAWHRLGGLTTLANASSEIRVEVLTASGDAVLLGDLDLSDPISLDGINAATHPYLRLRATLADSSQAGTPQLRRWYVTYDPVPDIAVDPAALVLSADTLQEGQPLDVTAVVSNLTPTVAPEVRVHYFVTDAGNRETLVASDTLRALAGEETATSSASIGTDGLAGTNRLRVQVSRPGGTDPVSYNNVLLRAFTVQPDQTPPSFAVTIDGQRYPNDPEPVRNVQDPTFPFVDVRPAIAVTVTDENAYKPLADSTVLRILLDGQEIPLSDPDVTFTPASEDNNEARLVFEPDLSGRDTTHTLVVHAYDAAGNEAADSPYQVHVRVQSSIAVESLYPYPNPMSSFTRFAFLLRGADAGLVDDFRIRIFTLTGRLVREFDLLDDPAALEGGGLRIGWNKLRWDGRDEDGDLLATGVYLYKVYLRAEGRAVPVNNKSGIEKLVVLR